jgi:hypothetical protein
VIRVFFFVLIKMRVEEERRIVDVAITEEHVPRRVASGRTVLATGLGAGGRYTYLVLANGDRLTRAGEYYFHKRMEIDGRNTSTGMPKRHAGEMETTYRQARD